jgi:hypothetical protein
MLDDAAVPRRRGDRHGAEGAYAQFATGAFGGCAIIALAVWNAF